MRTDNRILDADMATVGRWLGEGLGWWRDELVALLPLRLRRGRDLRNYFTYRGDGPWEREGSRHARTVLVDPSLCLVRTISLPPLRHADLQRVVALDADRILPMPPADLVIAAAADPVDRTRVTVAGLPRRTAARMLARLAEAKVPASRIGLADEARPGHIAADFTAALVNSGLLKSQRKVAARWWLAAVILFALNLGMLVWRDVQRIEQLRALVAAQAPAVAAARAISGRISDARGRSLLLLEKRRTNDALAMLGVLSATLPRQAWVQDLDWNGDTIRLTGTKGKWVDVAGAMRRSAVFSDVRRASAEARDEDAKGDPFDITMRVRSGRP